MQAWIYILLFSLPAHNAWHMVSSGDDDYSRSFKSFILNPNIVNELGVLFRASLRTFVKGITVFHLSIQNFSCSEYKVGLYLAGQAAPGSGLQGVHAIAIFQWPGLPPLLWRAAPVLFSALGVLRVISTTSLVQVTLFPNYLDLQVADIGIIKICVLLCTHIWSSSKMGIATYAWLYLKHLI